MSKKILITGVTGFVGSHMADLLISDSETNNTSIELHGLKRWHHSDFEKVRHIQDKIKWHDCDLTDPIGTRDMIVEIMPDEIYHFAAESFVSPSWKHPDVYMRVNYNGTVNILDALKVNNLKTRILIPGSGEEYGDIPQEEIPINEQTLLRPVNPYAVSKIAQDMIAYVYFCSYETQAIRTRAFNHEGPRRENVFGIPWYAYQIAKIENGRQEPLMKVGHLEDRRNFTHVRDMVEAYYIAMKMGQPGELYLLGTEREESVFTFREALEKLISMSSVKNIPYEQDSQYVRPTAVPRLIGDMSKFEALSGWHSKISFETILQETLDYWRKRVKEGTA